MNKNKPTFENVVHWLVQEGLPLRDAVSICRRNLKDGLVILNKLKKS